MKTAAPGPTLPPPPGPRPPSREENRAAAKKATFWTLIILAAFALFCLLVIITNGIAFVVFGFAVIVGIIWHGIYDDVRHKRQR